MKSFYKKMWTSSFSGKIRSGHLGPPHRAEATELGPCCPEAGPPLVSLQGPSQGLGHRVRGGPVWCVDIEVRAHLSQAHGHSHQVGARPAVAPPALELERSPKNCFPATPFSPL